MFCEGFALRYLKEAIEQFVNLHQALSLVGKVAVLSLSRDFKANLKRNKTWRGFEVIVEK